MVRSNPRAEQHPDGHFDQYASHAVDTHGESEGTECARLTLVEGLTHRSAGVTAFGEEDYVAGIVVGIACRAYLRELLGERTAKS